MKNIFSISLIAMLFVMLGTTASANAADTEGLFSLEQMRQGKTLYDQHCASCHGANMSGGSAPAMSENDFLVGWSGPKQSLGDLLYMIKTTMPLGKGGMLSTQEYLNIVTYMLAENGLPSGNTTLLADDPRIEKIKLGTAEQRALAEKQGIGCAEVETFNAENVPIGHGPDQDELDKAGNNAEDWLIHGHGYSGHRFSSLKQINTENVTQLVRQCSYDTDDILAFQTLPLVRDGTLYFTNNTDTFAIDAANCEEIWRHQRALRCNELWQHSRGLSLKDGYVVRCSPDGYLYALNAQTGAMIWERRVNDSDVAGVGIPMPPLIYKDKVIIAPSNSDIGLKGWVRAYHLQDGKLIWNFDVVPNPGDPAAASWGSDEALQRGGGGIWTPFSFDVKTQTAYMAAANPGPAFYPQVRPGNNLYTNSMLALDVNNGSLRWYDQMTPADTHDLDLVHASPLFQVNGRNVVFVAGKDGYVHGIDRDSHERIYSVAVSRQENIEADISTESETRFCPGIGGGVQFNAPAFNPESNTVYVNSLDWCTAVRQTDEIRFVSGGLYMGGYFTMDPVEQASGKLSALNAINGEELWHYDSGRPMIATIISTGGGLVFSGELSGDL
ncbi:MAG: alcohol dehydrogenase (cytochrome c), partial [Planctomycetota bacterium]